MAKGGLVLCVLCKKQVNALQIEKLPSEYKKFVNNHFILKAAEELNKVSAFREKRLIYLMEKHLRSARNKGEKSNSLSQMQEEFVKMQKTIKEQQIRIEKQNEQLLHFDRKIKAYEENRQRSKDTFTKVASECEFLRRENSRLVAQNSILSARSSQKSFKPPSLGKVGAEHKLAALGLPLHSQATVKTPVDKHLFKGTFYIKSPLTNDSSIPGSAGELAKKAKAGLTLQTIPRW